MNPVDVGRCANSATGCSAAADYGTGSGFYLSVLPVRMRFKVMWAFSLALWERVRVRARSVATLSRIAWAASSGPHPCPLPKGEGENQCATSV